MHILEGPGCWVAKEGEDRRMAGFWGWGVSGELRRVPVDKTKVDRMG